MNFAHESAFALVAGRILAGLADLRCLEHLNPVVAAIADIKESVVAQLRAVEGAAEKVGLHFALSKISCPRTDAFAKVRATATALAFDGILPVRAEMADVLAGLRVDDQDATIAVAVR